MRQRQRGRPPRDLRFRVKQLELRFARLAFEQLVRIGQLGKRSLGRARIGGFRGRPSRRAGRAARADASWASGADGRGSLLGVVESRDDLSLVTRAPTAASTATDLSRVARSNANLAPDRRAVRARAAGPATCPDVTSAVSQARGAGRGGSHPARRPPRRSRRRPAANVTATRADGRRRSLRGGLGVTGGRATSLAARGEPAAERPVFMIAWTITKRASAAPRRSGRSGARDLQELRRRGRRRGHLLLVAVKRALQRLGGGHIAGRDGDNEDHAAPAGAAEPEDGASGEYGSANATAPVATVDQRGSGPAGCGRTAGASARPARSPARSAATRRTSRCGTRRRRVEDAAAARRRSGSRTPS